jgi:MtrB/PioB family decaheme-associated outer membrane protein
MTRLLSLVLVLGLSAPAWTADTTSSDQATAPAASEEKTPAAAPDTAAATAPTFAIRELDFGLERADSDTNSSRFREYRALPNGPVLPYLHFKGNKNAWYDVTAFNVLQPDARYFVDVRPWGLGIKASYVRIPHLFGNDARTLLTEQATGVWALSDTLQQSFQDTIATQFKTSPAGINFAFLNRLVAPSLAAANVVDLKLQRDRGQLEVALTKNKPLDVRVSYFNENRYGTRAAGTSFGFGNVVETPEPIQYRTTDYGLTAEYNRPWGLVRGNFHYNEFNNRVTAAIFDNPFRAIDSTDGSAYTGPAAGSIAGPKLGVVSLPPDNKATTGSLGFLVKFAGKSRFSTDVSLGQWTQNDAFLPLTSNTSIAVPSQGLPSSLDGKIKTLSLSSALSSHPVDHLYLNARFRRYDLTNDTPRIQLPAGYVRFDAVFEAIPRITVPYGVTTDALALSASYDFGKLTVEGGYKLDTVDRTFRETEKTTQNVGYARVDVRSADWLVLHGTFEKGSRGFSGLELEQSEDASQLKPGAPANLLAVDPGTLQTDKTPLCPAGTVCNLRYDQAEKDIARYGAFAELSPWSGKTTLTLSYIKGKDDYKNSLYGLTNADNEALSAEVDFTANDRVNLYGFYTRENVSTNQVARQSGATVSTNRLEEWSSEITDKVDSFGAGATLGIVKEKADLKLFANYQKVDGNNDISAPAGGTLATARRAIGGIADIPFFDDTKLYTLSAEVSYKATPRWTVGLGGWYQYYKLLDSNTTGLANYVPASFFLAASDSDFKGHLVYVRASYVW